MVLASLGIERSESALRALCDCTPFGTEALNAVDAARQLGFLGTAKQTLSPRELEAQVHNGLYPIVFVNMRPIDGMPGSHAFVVLAIEPSRVSVFDPLHGERDLSRPAFESAWAMMHGLTLLVRR